MNKISVFNFKSNPVRSIEKDGEPWFVASDVCKVLGLLNVTMALSRLDSDEQALISIEGLSRGNDSGNVINESGLYSLILGSRKPEAKEFKRWVTGEVLPSIRKTGSYSITPTASMKDPQLAAMVLMLTQLDGVKQEQESQRLELAEIRAKITATPEEYYTVAGYASLRGVSIDTNRANLLGRKASKISREHDVEICIAHSTIFGKVNSYHVDVLCETFKAI